MPTLPTFFILPAPAIPVTILQKITGAIIIRIILMNVSLMSLAVGAKDGKSQPHKMPSVMPIRT